MEAAFQPEHVLNDMYDARLASAPFTADVLEVLPALLFLQSRAAFVEERCWQQYCYRL